MTTTEEPQATPEKRKRNRWIGILIVAIAITAVVTAGITALLANVIERMGEASDSFTKVVELDDTVVDPAVWGQNFPAQYQSYLRTQEMGATTHAGSVAGGAHAHRHGPAHRRVHQQARGGSAAQGHVGRLPVRRGLPRTPAATPTCSRTSATPCGSPSSTSPAPASTATRPPSRS